MIGLSLNPPLSSRVGDQLRVVLVCRISKDRNERRSLADQQALLEGWLAHNYSGKTDIRVISGQGSGERLTRPEAERLQEIIDDNDADLIVTEDIGRILRRVLAFLICESCEDQGIRLIALNDQLDTFQDGWRLNGLFAALRHELYNTDTSKRIRRSQRNRFLNGGLVQTFPYGYEKPPGARSDAEIRKLLEAEQVYERWFTILETGGTFSDVADYLNANQIPLGPYCRSKTRQWNCSMVARITRNPLLKGFRRHNVKIAVRINRTGERKNVPASSEELLVRECPHLAFIDPQRFDRVIAMLELRNSKYRRKKIAGKDPRLGVPRKRTRWPGQHAYCGICGQMLVYGAHGLKGNLMCSGAREYQCWMSISFNSALARRKILEAIWNEIEQLPDFAAEMASALEAAAATQNKGLEQELRQLEARRTEHARHRSNLQRALREYGPTDLITSELKQMQVESDELQQLEWNLQQAHVKEVSVPSLAEVKSVLGNVLEQVAAESQDAARSLRQMIPQIVVSPFQILDGGHFVLRAEFVIDLSAAWPQQLPSAPELKRTIQVDLFEPPQREVFRKRIVELRAQGLMQREIADQLGITQPAVQNALKLQAKMDQQGVSDPYQQVTKPPSDSTRYKRHRHPRFRQDSSDEEQAA